MFLACPVFAAESATDSAAALPDADVEEQRLAVAKKRLAGVAGRYPVTELSPGEEAAPAEAGRMLWRRAVSDVQEGNLDDRPLYWSRLAGRLAGRPDHPASDPSRTRVRSFEYASRGFDDLRFPEAADTRRVLISGFDPFLLDRDIGQSNPSGLAALALDGMRLPVEKGWVWIEAVIFPVRYEDFDEGIVESVLADALASHSIDLVVTISMGRDAFDLERFPGRRRSATAPDNRNVVTGANARTPLIPNLAGAPLEGPEFVEFSLPAAAMQVIQSPWPVRDNRRVISLERGELEPATLTELSFDTAVQGSGGGYLSNEISYRSVLLLERMGAHVPVGHLHTPSVAGHDAVIEGRMLAQIRALLTRAASALEGTSD
ncbi:MAG: hypothetical protein R3E82_02075 [Pseudomonadales bacterium]|nr:hypothetical protein [Pseudomonadales bacterium]